MLTCLCLLAHRPQGPLGKPNDLERQALVNKSVLVKQQRPEGQFLSAVKPAPESPRG